MHIANKTNIVSIITVCKRYRLKPINLVYRLKLRVFLALFCEFGVPYTCSNIYIFHFKKKLTRCILMWQQFQFVIYEN